MVRLILARWANASARGSGNIRISWTRLLFRDTWLRTVVNVLASCCSVSEREKDKHTCEVVEALEIGWLKGNRVSIPLVAL